MKTNFLLKNVYILPIVSFFLTSCEKTDTDLVTKNNSLSLYESEYKFRKELIVSDNEEKNSVYLAISSNDEDLLESYIANISYSLSLENEFVQTANSQIKSSNDVELDTNYFNITEEPKIVVEVIATNFIEDAKTYSLTPEITSTNLKSTNTFLFGTPVGYETEKWNNYIGITHQHVGYEHYIRPRVKWNWYNSWKDYYAEIGKDYTAHYQGYSVYGDDCVFWMKYSSYKKGIVVYPHLYQKTINYKLYYDAGTQRGIDCSYGYYDGAHCCIGTPPSGTTAFIYNNNFYYTPVNGNQCPYSGSYYDGANCFVMDIPADNPGFIWNNNWYIYPDLVEID